MFQECANAINCTLSLIFCFFEKGIFSSELRIFSSFEIPPKSSIDTYDGARLAHTVLLLMGTHWSEAL